MATLHLGSLSDSVVALLVAIECQAHRKIGREIRSATVGFDGTLVYLDQVCDDSGRIRRRSEPYYPGDTAYWTEFFYDALGRVTETRHPDYLSTANATEVSYEGLTTTITNGKNQVKTEERNGAGELVRVTDDLGGFVDYTYDAQGNLKGTSQGGPGVASAVTTVNHDLLGRKTSMSDPDMGTWSYEYNAFGELIRQTDALGQYTTVESDLLGRMTSRIDHSGGAIESDSAWIYDVSPNGIGQLAQEDVTEGAAGVPSLQRSFTYDVFGRSTAVTTTISSASYVERTSYDQFGRLFQRFDGATPVSGLEYYYNARGYLEQVIESSGSAAQTHEYYRIDGLDARGQVQALSKGGITVSYNFDPATGRPETFIAANLVQTVQDLTFAFDVLGNLTGKHDRSLTPGGVYKNLNETYGYDDLNRLTSVARNSVTTLMMGYNALGNITSKSDVGSYSYGSRPHAVTGAGGNLYGYDANGAMTSGNGRTIGHSAFHNVDFVSRYGNSTTISYGPNRERFRRVEVRSGAATTTHYVGSIERIWRSDGVVETKRYLDGEVIVTTRSDGTADEHYILADHLGSTDMLIDDAGGVTQAMSFDPWGQRRDAGDFSALSGSEMLNFDTSITTRGFTGHEGLDQMGLVHMNGRVYEPKLGRFVSGDPFVQFPSYTQSFNRYSYVLNNPLTFSDPSGYQIGVIGWTIIASIVKEAYIQIKQALGNKASLPSVPGVAAGAMGGGPGGNAGWAVPRYGAEAGPLSGCHGYICHLNGGGPTEIIVEAVVGETGSEETGWKFLNGGYWFSFFRSVAGDQEHEDDPPEVADGSRSLSRRQCVLAWGGCTFSVSENPSANGGAPWYEIGSLSQAGEYSDYIDVVAQVTKVDARLIKAVMYVEMTHGYYDALIAPFDANKSILPMNINTQFWGASLGSRAALKNPQYNIVAGAFLLRGIQANLPAGASVAQIATLYNYLPATVVSDYGARVSALYDAQPWGN